MMFVRRKDRGMAGLRESPLRGSGAPDLAAVEALGDEILGTMRGLQQLLEARAEELETLSATLETRKQEVLAARAQLRDGYRDLADREQRLVATSEELDGRKTTLDALARDVGTRRDQLEPALTAERQALEQRAAGLGGEERRLQAVMAELVERQGAIEERARALEAENHRLDAERTALDSTAQTIAEREARLERAEREAQSARAQSEAELEAQRRELEKTREHVAMLQTRLEAELRKAAGIASQPRPADDAASGEAPDSLLQYPAPGPQPVSESPDALGRLQKLSRDARRRAMGG